MIKNYEEYQSRSEKHRDETTGRAQWEINRTKWEKGTNAGLERGKLEEKTTNAALANSENEYESLKK